MTRDAAAPAVTNRTTRGAGEIHGRVVDQRPGIGNTRPLVSVGLPTHNGAGHLRDALDSLVAQDYPNLEILISDNASDDETPRIAAEFAAGDPRVRVVRQATNIGAAANFNLVLRETAGPLFMWAGDDDSWEPTYVTACVAALEANPDAVLACSRLSFTGEDVDPEYERNYEAFDNPDLSSGSVRHRIRDLLSRPGWYLVYGVMRRDAIAADPFESMYGADVVLLVRLAVLSRFVRVNDVLFHYRVYRTREAPRSPLEGLSERRRSARNIYLVEGCARAIRDSRASRLQKVRAMVGLVQAAYLRPTLLRMQMRSEARARIDIAVAESDFASFAKYVPIHAAKRVRSVVRRAMGGGAP